MSVVCLVEHDAGVPIDSSLRTLTFARGIAAGLGDADLVAVVFGPPAATLASSLASFGVASAYAVELPGAAEGKQQGVAPLGWARALSEVARRSQATAVVAASTDYGSEVPGHLGALGGLPMAANCFEAERLGDGTWRYGRYRWGGSLIETGILEGTPALLTVATDAVPAEPAASAPGSLAVEVLQPELSEGDLAVQASESRSASGGVSLANARVVVSGGRGVGGPDGYAVLEELAGLLGGAVGVSRVATSLGWRPHSQQVGQTGTRVSPDLYLACGISGAIQHLAGCQSAKTMIAINTDPAAAIMGRADYAVIGDLHEVLPALVEALRARPPASR